MAKGAVRQTEADPAMHAQLRRLLNQGARLLEQGRARDAIPYLERACSLDSTNVPALINLGGAYIMLGRHREAVPLLETARGIEPFNAMVWLNLGAAYLGNPLLATSEQQMGAIAAFERAIQLDPMAPSAHYNLGLIFIDRSETELAVAAFRKAVEANPLDRDARLWLRRLEAGEEEASGS